MNDIYASTALHLDEPIDARHLTLSLDFYLLQQDQVIALSNKITEWLFQFLDHSFVSRYSFDGKRTSLQKVALNATEFIKEKTFCTWSAIAFVKNAIVYNSRTMGSHLTVAQRGYHPLSLDVSVDYQPFWDALDIKKDNSFMDREILKIFREPHRKLVAGYVLPDIQSSFRADSYQRDKNLWYGNFTIHFCRFCIGNAIEAVADTFCKFAKTISEIFSQVNARVQLQPTPWKSPYMRYFGKHGDVDDSHLDSGFLAREWYDTYYAPGVEWFNILSPLTQCHLTEINLEATFAETIHVEKLASGGLTICSKKKIDEYDIDDAISLKQIINPALYPGGSHIPLRMLYQEDPMKFVFGTLPRSDWAIVPVLDNEIGIIGTDLVFWKSTTVPKI